MTEIISFATDVRVHMRAMSVMGMRVRTMCAMRMRDKGSG